MSADPGPAAATLAPRDGADDLAPEQLLELYRDLVRVRVLDEKCVAYSRQGRIISPYPIFWGHEALYAGSAYAMAPEDWVFPSYRDAAVAMLRGVPISSLLAQWRGHPAGWWDPWEHRVGGVTIPVATHVPHAAGLAWGLRMRGEPGCAVVYFGDGATSEGIFHEGANFAAVTEAPVVLFCNNNSWAISTPLSAQTRARRLADKAVGYGMPGVQVDGNDVLAVYRATREALERARAGGGPTLIEAVTYRMAPHATSDDPRLYADPERIERERANECVGRFERHLLELGVLDDETVERCRQEALQAMREAIAEAEAMPAPGPEWVHEVAHTPAPGGAG